MKKLGIFAVIAGKMGMNLDCLVEPAKGLHRRTIEKINQKAADESALLKAQEKRARKAAKQRSHVGT